MVGAIEKQTFCVCGSVKKLTRQFLGKCSNSENRIWQSNQKPCQAWILATAFRESESHGGSHKFSHIFYKSAAFVVEYAAASKALVLQRHVHVEQPAKFVRLIRDVIVTFNVSLQPLSPPITLKWNTALDSFQS